jgi:hypothetical protein
MYSGCRANIKLSASFSTGEPLDIFSLYYHFRFHIGRNFLNKSYQTDFHHLSEKYDQGAFIQPNLTTPQAYTARVSIRECGGFTALVISAASFMSYETQR